MRNLRPYEAVMLILVSLGVQAASAVTWSNGSQITSSPTVTSQYPSLLYNFKTFKSWVFWASNQLVNFSIYYRIYDPACLQSACLLPPVARLSLDSHQNIMPSSAQTLDGNIWVFWVSDRTGNNDVFYKVFNGTSWTQDSRFTTWIGNDVHPSVLATLDGSLWVAWASDMACSASPCLSNVFLRKFNGTWSTIQQVTFSGRDFEPALSQSSDGTVWLAWSSDRVNSGKFDIYYKTITPAGSSLDTQLTKDPSIDSYPSVVAVKNGAIVVVWASDRNTVFDTSSNATVPEFDLFFKSSVDGGVSWSSDTQLTHDPILNPPTAVDDIRPSAVQMGQGKIGVVWQSSLTLNWNIFSLTLLIADIAVTAVSPAETVLAQGETLKVNATLLNLGWEPESLGVTLATNGTLVGSVQTSVGFQGTRTISLSWNTTGWSLGRYVLKVTAANLTGESNPGNNVLTRTVMLTIPGDVNGDRTVNILDLVAVAIVFGTRIGSPGYNPNADVNRDGVINILDLTFVALRFGQTG